MSSSKVQSTKALIALALSVSTGATGLGAIAAPLSYSPQSKDTPAVVSVSLPLANLGSLSVPGGYITVDSNSVEVFAVPEGLFDSRKVLSGVLVTAGGGDFYRGSRSPVLRGQMYFFGGSWLGYLGSSRFEVVEKTDGTLVTGQIVEGSETALTVRTAAGQSVVVPFCDIVNLESPRAFSFVMPYRGVGASQAIAEVQRGDAVEIKLSGSLSRGQRKEVGQPLKRPINAPLGDERGISNGTLAAYLMANLFWTVAPAVATPLVFGRSLAGPINRIKAANALSFPGYTGLP